MKRFEEEVELARITMPPRTIMLLTVIGGLVLGTVVSTSLARRSGPRWAGRSARRETRDQASSALCSTAVQQLPDNLDVLSSGLRAGHSFIGALSVVCRRRRRAVEERVPRVIADEQLGVPIDEALHVSPSG